MPRFIALTVDENQSFVNVDHIIRIEFRTDGVVAVFLVGGGKLLVSVTAEKRLSDWHEAFSEVH